MIHRRGQTDKNGAFRRGEIEISRPLRYFHITDKHFGDMTAAAFLNR
jgi:hypothetical protein